VGNTGGQVRVTKSRGIGGGVGRRTAKEDEINGQYSTQDSELDSRKEELVFQWHLADRRGGGHDVYAAERPTADSFQQSKGRYSG
jgi:hypothetical protein